jgi:hypothetical protein
MSETIKSITLTLTLPEVNVVINGISQLPMGQVIDLFHKIKTQAESQIVEVTTPTVE